MLKSDSLVFVAPLLFFQSGNIISPSPFKLYLLEIRDLLPFLSFSIFVICSFFLESKTGTSFVIILFGCVCLLGSWPKSKLASRQACLYAACPHLRKSASLSPNSSPKPRFVRRPFDNLLNVESNHFPNPQ